MSYKDVREWIQKVDEMGELKIVENADLNLEIGGLSVLSSKHKENTPALLFDASRLPGGLQNPRRLLRELRPFRSSMHAGLSNGWQTSGPPPKSTRSIKRV